MAKKKKTISDKKRITALILCVFFGWLGLHRFYVNKFFTGFFMMFTFGGFGLLIMIDFFMIIFGNFNDSYGRKLENWI